MRLIFAICFCVFFSKHVYCQDSIKQLQDKASKVEPNYASGSFVPHSNLLNNDLWKRVSEFRFECEYLRLAVEFRDHSYLLLEMDGEKRILAKSINYNVISGKIIELTLNPRPSLNNLY